MLLEQVGDAVRPGIVARGAMPVRVRWPRIVAALAALEGVTGLLAPYTGQNFYSALCVVLPIGNAMLRVISTEGLTK